MKEIYHITGMTCSACSAHVEKSVSALKGIHRVSVNLLLESMEVEYDSKVLDGGQIVEAVERAGYGAAIKGEKKAGKKEEYLKEKEKEERNMRRRLLVSVVCLIPLMYVAMVHMHGGWWRIQLLLLLPILYVNRTFFTVGFFRLWKLSPNMDSLIALGCSASVGYSLFALWMDSHELYFESAGMILTLVTVGKYLENRSKGKTSEAVGKLMDLSPQTALLLTPEGEEREVPTEQLRVGDVFLVKPGAKVPVDGIVLSGNSGVNESAITGESIPVDKCPGDKVVSATLNGSGFLKCRAQRVGEDTTLAQIIRLVEEAGGSKAPIAKLADQVAGVFVPVVMGIALLTLAGWLLAGAGMEFALSCAIAVLVISCPCALGLATPVAIMVGTGVGAGRGILIKSGEALQRVKEIDTVVLDKTGTVTAGELRVVQVGVTVPDMSLDVFMQIAAGLENKSEHPLGEAVVSYAKRDKLHIPEIIDFKAVFGRGVEGVLAEELRGNHFPTGDGPTSIYGDEALLKTECVVPAGKRFFVGNAAYLQEKGIVFEATALQGVEAMAEEGMTPVLMAEEGRYLGAIGVADRIKSSSVKAVHAWRKMGIRVIMLTGDNRRTARAVQRELGLEEVVAEVLPADKERLIRQWKVQGKKVAMIGDGINDAPALVSADVGIAIGAGTDIAVESADIVLMKHDLRDAVTAMKLGRSVIRNIKQNLFWAFFYNIMGIPLAAGLWYPAFGVRLSPMFGAAAMSLSSLFVVGNALRLRRFCSGFKGKDSAGEENIRRESIREENIEMEEAKQVMEKKLIIEGMMCAHCTGRVQKVLEAVDGVTEVVMSLEQKSATVKMDKEVDDEVLVTAVTDAGYEVTGVEK